MKRDFELIRRILLAIEANEERPDSWKEIEFPNQAPEFVSYQICLLEEAGLIVADERSHKQAFEWIPIRLTWKGHEFLDAARNDKAWKKAMEKIKKLPGSVSFSILQLILQKSALKILGLE